MKKKAISLIISALIIGGLAGCSKKDTDVKDTSNKVATEEKVKEGVIKEDTDKKEEVKKEEDKKVDEVKEEAPKQEVVEEKKEEVKKEDTDKKEEPKKEEVKKEAEKPQTTTPKKETTNTNSNTTKPSNGTSTGNKTEPKPAETKPAETKPAETKPAETKPAVQKPLEYKADLTQQVYNEMIRVGVVNTNRIYKGEQVSYFKSVFEEMKKGTKTPQQAVDTLVGYRWREEDTEFVERPMREMYINNNGVTSCIYETSKKTASDIAQEMIDTQLFIIGRNIYVDVYYNPNNGTYKIYALTLTVID